MNKLFISDNLPILKELPSSSIDCIYTDPPYLTKGTKLSYKDNYSISDWTNLLRDTMTECQRLLKPTGMLLIHIDDYMQVELNQILFSIFGKSNKICQFVWHRKASLSNQAKFASISHEYVLVFAKSIQKASFNRIPNPKPDCLVHFRMGGKHASIQNNPNQHYPIFSDGETISLQNFPGSKAIFPTSANEETVWRTTAKSAQKLINASMLVVKNNKILSKQYKDFTFNYKTGQLDPFIRSKPIQTILQGDNFPSNIYSNKEIKKIFGSTAFSYAKPSVLVKNLLKIVSNEEDTILDPFAGSGTTGQAAFETNRRFILIQRKENDIENLTEERLAKTIGSNNFEVIK